MLDIVTVTMNPALDVSSTTAQVRPTSKLRCEQVQRHPGGGGINVARVLHRLGANCLAVYPMGGSTGQLLSQLLDAEGVLSVRIPIGGHIRESFTVLDESTQQEYRFVLPGPELTDAECKACLSHIAKRHPHPRFLVGSGSLPPGVPVDFYATMAQQAATSGSHFILDTSGPALVAALKQGVYMVKPSLREIRELTQAPLTTMAEVAQAARLWVDTGQAAVVVVSMGEQGALLVSADDAIYAPPLPVKVVSAVGAGDSFVAGMTWALSQGKHLADAFASGVACGSAALMSTGTGLCEAAEVHRLLGQVQLLREFPAHSI
jgi:6-phosphofructokinase 2